MSIFPVGLSWGAYLTRSGFGDMFDEILAKMHAHISHWSMKLLSMGGKLILLRHVLNSIPVYLLQVLKPPKAVLIALGRIFNSFFGIKCIR